VAKKSLRTKDGRLVRPTSQGRTAEVALSEIIVVEGLCDMNGAAIELEGYQAAFMAAPARFRCVEKARQLGFSWIFAAEALARAHLRPNHTSIFVSYNLEDAKEKIRYAKMLYESMPDGFRKKLVEDAKTGLAFKDPDSGAVSRIISFPSKAPRGKGGDLYLDEFAHYMSDEDVYAGSTALIARHPQAQLTVCSTPAGRRGTFWAIAKQETEKRYPGFFRQRVPWWLSRHYCTDMFAARKDGIDHMTTDERLEKWGLPAIQEQRASLLLEDFQQEFEVAYIDEAHSFYPWGLINSCAKDVALQDDSAGWEVSGRLTAGYDVGRKRDVSAMTILEEIDGHYYPRYLNTWARMPFEEQFLVCCEALDSLPIQVFHIDPSGIGMQLAESLVEKYGPVRIQPVNFTQQSKELLATDLKILMEKGDITFPKHRDLLTQTHSIRRISGRGGKPQFDSEQNARHHGDLFWSYALAAKRDREGVEVAPRITFTARVIG